MADDKLNLEVEISAHTRGLEGAAREVSLAQDAIESLHRTSQISSKTLAEFSKASERMASSVSSGGSAVQKQLSAFEQMQQEVRKTSKALRELAQDNVVSGGRAPLASVSGVMSLEEAQKIVAVLEAQSVTAGQVAYRVVAAEREKQAAFKASADAAAAAAKQVSRIAQQENASSARNRTQSRAGGVWAQGQLYDTGSAMKARETSWAREAEAVKGLNLQYDAHVKAYKRVQRERSVASKQTALYNQYLYDQEKALSKSTQAARTNTDSVISLRYANYDLATSLLGTSAAITAVGGATLTAFASQEKAFADVARTLQTDTLPQQVAEIEESLRSLSTQIPLTFEELSRIATIGNQMGIEADNVVDFTNTIARFAAITGISIDETTKAFGGFMAQTGMAPENLENLGSAIAKVGIDSNATETQILSLMREITAGATGAGFAEEQIVALSGTLASLQIAPERARGSLTTYFETLNKAVANGGEDLEKFAQIVGVTGAELDAMVRQGRGNDILRGFLEGLKDLDNVDTTSALDDLGLAQLRVSDTFRRLSGSLNLYDRDQQNANQAFREATELQRQYGFITETVAAKWQIFLNALMNFAAAVGSELAPAAAEFLTIATDVLTTVTKFVETPFGGAVTKIVASLAGMVAAWAGIRGAIALVTGSMQAFQYIVQATGSPSILAGVQQLVAAYGQVKLAADQATASVGRLNGAAAGSAAAAQNVTTTATTATASTTVLGSAVADTDKKTGKLSGTLGKLGKAGGTAGGIFLLVQAFTDLRGTVISLIDTAEYLLTNTFATGMGFAGPFIGVVVGLAEALGFADSSAGRAATSSINFGAAIQEVGNVISVAATVFLAPFQYIQQGAAVASAAIQIWALNLQRNLQWAANIVGPVLNWIGNAFANVSEFVGKFVRGFENGMGAYKDVMGGFFDGLRDLASHLPGAGDGVSELSGAMSDLGGAFESTAPAISDVNDSLGDTGPAAKEAAKEVRTLVDYANDLKAVWDRAFEIRFSGQSTLDQIRSTYHDIRDAAAQSAERMAGFRKAIEDSRRSIQSLKADIQGLRSDIKIQEYFLSIAVEYGDTQRAAAIEANLAKLRADLAEKTADLREENDAIKKSQKDLKKEQDANSKSLTGNSQAAIQNRETLRSLVQQYQSHLGALAASGMSQKDLAIATERLRQDFIKQATQLGYNRSEVMRYAKAFDDVRIAVSKVPRNITVKANTNPAQQAFNELNARLNTANRGLTNLRNNAKKPIKFPPIGNPNNAKELRRMALEAEMLVHSRNASRLSALGGAGNMQGARLSAQEAARIRRVLASGNYWSGGYTGQGGKYEPAGIVHRGEYVIPKQDVNQATGLPYADALGRLMQGSSGGSSAPAPRASASSTSTVNLSPGSVQALAHAIKPYLFIDGKMVADASSKSYAQQNTVGAY